MRKFKFFATITAGLFCAAAALLSVVAQSGAEGADVRAMNGQLLQLLERLQSDSGPNANALRAEAAALIRQRSAALASLIGRNPAEAIQTAFPADVVAEIASRVPAGRAHLESHGTWQGPIEYIVEDGADFKTHRNIRTMTTGGETLSIEFAGREPEELKNGDTLRVEGVRAGDRLAALGASIVKGAASGNGRPAPPPPPPTCTTLGAQKSIVLMVTMPGAALPASVTPGGVWDAFFNTSQATPSLTDFWRENSYGATTAVGTVAPGPNGGWYTLDRAYGDDETNAIRTAAINAADADVNFTQYNRLFLVINGMPVTINYAGQGTIGCGYLSSADGTFNASTSWIRANNYGDPERGPSVTIHEAGHNLGLHHANSRDFDTEALGAPGAAGVVTEYEDVFSEMGRGRAGGHYAAPHKVRLGWLSAQVQTVTGSGDYTIQPVENAGSALALKVRRGTDSTKWLWVEYRQPLGIYDNRLAAPFLTWGAAYYLDASLSHIYTGGLIHYEDATTGLYSHLLDFTPGSLVGSTVPVVADDWLDPPLVGAWTDPYSGLRLTTSNPTGAGLTVNVYYDPAFCGQLNPTVTLSPANPSVKRGQSVTYTVAVTNNDTAPCLAKAFDLSSSLPAGWGSSFSQSPLVIAPGAAATVSMTKTVPADAAYTTYSVNATATSGTFTGTGTASATVKPGK